MGRIRELIKYMRHLGKRQVVLVLAILAIFNFMYSYSYDRQVKIVESNMTELQQNQVDVMQSVLLSRFESIYTNLNIIKNSDEFTAYMSQSNEQTRAEAEALFSRIAMSSPAFMQIRYLDESGLEIIRVNRQGELITAVGPDELQNKATRYYFQDALEVPEGIMYISEFDLNVEHGSVVKPYEPVIRFAMPIKASNGEKGILIINYDGYQLLDELKRYDTFEGRDMEVGILDGLYYWDVRLNSVEERDTLGSSSLSIELSDDPEGVSAKASRLETGSFIHGLYRYYYSTMNFDNAFPATFRAEDKHWKVISRFSLDAVIRSNSSIIVDYPGLRYLMLIFVGILSSLILAMVKVSANNNLMLKASSYISAHTHDGVIIVDKHMSVVFCNQVFETTFGWTSDEIIGHKIDTFFNIDENSVDLDIARQHGWDGNVWNPTGYGAFVNKHLHIHTINNKDQVGYYIGIYSTPKLEMPTEDIDISSLKRENLEHYIEEYDLVKQTKRINDFLAQYGSVIGYAIKLKEYSSVIHTLPEYGENYLIGSICSELSAFIFEDSIIFSPVSDIIVILIAQNKRRKDIDDVTRKLDIALSSAKYKIATDSKIAFLCGYSIYPRAAKGTEELLNQMFVAMDANIRLVNTPFLQYDSDIYDLVLKDHSIQSEVENGFSNDEFYVVYQPQNDAFTNSVVGVEALVRWQNPELGLVSPDRFIPIMIRTGSIMRLGLLVLGKIIEDFERQAIEMDDGFRIALNLSSEEFMDKRVISEILYMIGQSQFDFTRFCIEITETTVLDNIKAANEMIAYLNEYGVIVAIDDFGTGFSSLSYIKQLQVDKLKIDRLFIMDYPIKDDGTIFKAIMTMAKNLGLKTVVEGIETPEQLEYGKALGCDEYQGYIYSKPVRIELLEKLIRPE